jgi:SpoVK/Ycf46/Vps4 family AAA+-type ATPase
MRAAGSVSTDMAEAVAAERYAEFDENRRAAEAERAMLDEADDLRRLTALEQRRGVADDPADEGER